MTRLSPDAVFRPRPFLKWAGGKRQLLEELLSFMPQRFNAYHEPMLGGGALFFELAGRSRMRKAMLSDLNEDLICAYSAVKERTPELILSLKKRVYDPDEYYRIRGLDPLRLDPVERAARLVYLNKTCYNGLYRVNSRGEFNVPFGRYRNPRICDEVNLQSCSLALRRAEIRCRPFEEVLRTAKRGDFVYFDPPYYPVSETANFSAYEKSGFGAGDHRRLRDVFAELARKGCYAMVSNSHCDFTLKLFGGFRIDVVQGARAVNSKASGRGPVREIIVRNY